MSADCKTSQWVCLLSTVVKSYTRIILLRVQYRSTLRMPGATGNIPGPYLPKSLLVPPKREVCPLQVRIVPKESNRLGATGVRSSRPETPKILDITPEFVCTNCFFAYFAIRIQYFCCFMSELVKIRTFSEKRTYFCLVILPQYAYSWNFTLNNFAFWSTLSNSRYESFCALPKFVYAPQ